MVYVGIRGAENAHIHTYKEIINGENWRKFYGKIMIRCDRIKKKNGLLAIFFNPKWLESFYLIRGDHLLLCWYNH